MRKASPKEIHQSPAAGNKDCIALVHRNARKSPSVVSYSKKLTFASNRWIEKPVLEEDGRDASYT
jgi:hypothetical protein